MEKHDPKAKLLFTLSMLIFGTIGVLRKSIPLPSGMIAMFRGLIGAAFLLPAALIKRERPAAPIGAKTLLLTVAAGALLGVNWMALFEAYQYASVATATLCYYMAPIFVILLSPILFNERLTGRKIGCAAVAIAGTALISGVFNASAPGDKAYVGILLGLGAAFCYAGVIVLNKKAGAMEIYRKTTLELATAAAVLLPYALLDERAGTPAFTPQTLALLAVIGIVHTALAYALYFRSIKSLPAQTVALFSYIDPLTAILLSALMLREGMDAAKIIGATLILGAALISDLPKKGALKEYKQV